MMAGCMQICLIATKTRAPLDALGKVLLRGESVALAAQRLTRLMMGVELISQQEEGRDGQMAVQGGRCCSCLY